ncbi:hypothetical protein B0H13DRAFT_1877405 [Mycena leptocephala]|nr:hypothetical protein B0H13DRAFT_1877405 [Mycena leptocephala]
MLNIGKTYGDLRRRRELRETIPAVSVRSAEKGVWANGSEYQLREEKTHDNLAGLDMRIHDGNKKERISLKIMSIARWDVDDVVKAMKANEAVLDTGGPTLDSRIVEDEGSMRLAKHTSGAEVYSGCMVRNRRRIDFEGRLTEVGELCRYAALSIGYEGEGKAYQQNVAAAEWKYRTRGGLNPVHNNLKSDGVDPSRWDGLGAGYYGQLANESFEYVSCALCPYIEEEHLCTKLLCGGAKEDPVQKISAFGRITRIYVGFKDLGGAAGKIEVNRRADS